MEPDPATSLIPFLVSVVFVVASLVFYVFFISASIALARCRGSVLRELREEGWWGSKSAEYVLAQADTFLLCVQFGRVLASLGVGILLAVCSYYGALAVATATMHLSFGVWIGVVAAFYAVCALFLLVLVQIVKNITLQYPEKVLCTTAGPLKFYGKLFAPVLIYPHRCVLRILERWGVRLTNERELTISAAELGEIAKSSSEAGTLESEESHILEGVAELSERTARDVMTTRSNIIWVRESASSAEVVAVANKESVSRLLVCGSELDDVRGMLLIKDLLNFAGQPFQPSSWRRFIRPVYRIPDTKIVKNLLVELRQKRVHFSVVLNEHGEVVGLVTLEDLVEEIVGEIFDEFDNPSLENPPIAVENGVLYLDAAVTIEVLEEEYGLSFPEGNFHSAGGFVHESLGRIPVLGDSFSASDMTFVVLEVHRHRIIRLSIAPRVAREDFEETKAVSGCMKS
jgi:CBS domain containing-hemolysin-like protein